MSTVIESAAPSKVDAVMGQIVTELGATLGILLTDLGLRSGLWAAMRGVGPVSVADLTVQAGVPAPLVREWVRSQAAGGYLDYQPDTDRYILPEPVAVALLDAPGGAMIGACTEMLESMLDSYDDLAAAFTGDGSFGWHQRDPRHWHGTDRLTRAQLPADLIGAALATMPGIPDALDAGGRVLDVGCGFGFPTTVIADRFPRASVVGVDYHRQSVDEARRTAEAAGVGDRVTFTVAAATDLPGSNYALVTFFDSLHDFGEPVAALRAARDVLAPGGAVLVCDNDAAERVVDNLNPVGRMYYAVSTLICTPNALSQQGPVSPEPLGTYAGAAKLSEVAHEAGFTRATRLTVPGALNLFLDLRP
ncbi:MAG TPA: class I SAM-dependent methyltransferase [Propionibacteriaceae bacterium]|nr:class I SAM-dependent methyltransferase [Propionibacteriaceae bacterium]